MPRKIKRTGMFIASCLGQYSLSVQAHAAAFTYAPATVLEYHSDVLGDDDCDAEGAAVAPPIHLAVDDTVTWTYVYGASPTGYAVESSDKADIEILEIKSPVIVGGDIVTNLTLQFMSGTAAEIPLSGVYDFGNVTWATNRCSFRKNNILGNLSLITDGLLPITGFRIVATQIAGTVDVDSMTFRWEAGDIDEW